MKHFEADLVAALRSQLSGLGGDDRAKRALAIRLGIRQPELTRILRCQIPVPAAVAEKLGFRRVTFFEPI